MGKGQWSVMSQVIDGKRKYLVYRKRDTEKVDHAGNRETVGTYCEDRTACEALARYLNEKEAEA